MKKRGTRALGLLFNKRAFPKAKRSQVTIFIIAGMIVVVAISSFLFFRGEAPIKTGKSPEKNPEAFLSSCIEGKVKEAIGTISMQGGYIEPELYKTFRFEGEDPVNISYLCYTQNYYVPCINHEPMLMSHLKKEIKNYIAEDMEVCFDELKNNLEKQNYEVSMDYRGFEVDLISKRVIIKTDSEITLTRTEESSKKENLEANIPSRFYDIAAVVQEILSQEARFCNFDYLGFMIINPQFNIDRFKTSDLETIYTVRHENSKEKFRFAVRSCIIPPGL